MEVVLLAFALGAGTVVAYRHGRRIAREAVGWTAKKAGQLSGELTSALAEAKEVARREYERGRDHEAPRIVETAANGEAAPPADAPGH